jgi:uncharacterized protein Yka (UPF0111/DUF47 family)
MLLRLFRSFMPKDESFVERLSQHAEYVMQGAVAFRSLLADGEVDARYAELRRLEEAADTVIRDTIQAIHRSFITPFDRPQILALITALDDTIDLMKETGRRLRLYGVSYTPEMLAMADCAVRATADIRQAIPLLGSIARNVAQLDTMQTRVRQAETEADELLDRGLRKLFSTEDSAGRKLTIEKVYDLIEAVVDRCEDVADVLAGIVVEQV